MKITIVQVFKRNVHQATYHCAVHLIMRQYAHTVQYCGPVHVLEKCSQYIVHRSCFQRTLLVPTLSNFIISPFHGLYVHAFFTYVSINPQSILLNVIPTQIRQFLSVQYLRWMWTSTRINNIPAVFWCYSSAYIAMGYCIEIAEILVTILYCL